MDILLQTLLCAVKRGPFQRNFESEIRAAPSAKKIIFDRELVVLRIKNLSYILRFFSYQMKSISPIQKCLHKYLISYLYNLEL